MHFLRPIRTFLEIISSSCHWFLYLILLRNFATMYIQFYFLPPENDFDKSSNLKRGSRLRKHVHLFKKKVMFLMISWKKSGKAIGKCSNKYVNCNVMNALRQHLWFVSTDSLYVIKFIVTSISFNFSILPFILVERTTSNIYFSVTPKFVLFQNHVHTAFMTK